MSARDHTDTGELFPLERALRGLRERFADAVLDADRGSLREHLVVVPAARLREVAGAVHREWGGALLAAFGLDERDPHGRFRLHYLFSMAPEDAVLTLIAAVPGDDPRFPSVAPVVPAAAWSERELRDLLGVTASGHPDPRPLVAHDGWPPHFHPLRRDFAPTAEVSWTPQLAAPAAAGGGAFEIPVGPVHGVIAEAGRFRLSTAGEDVLALDVRLGWAYRGLETLAAGARVGRGLELAERTCGRCAFSHALAFSLAVEEMTGTLVPPRARALRVLAGELERLHNHVGDLAAMLSEIAYTVGAAEGMRLRELLQQVNAALFGHRLLRGVCVPGGVARDLEDGQQRWLRGVLGEVRADVAGLAGAALANPTVTDRLDGAGRLARPAAHALGAVGPAARAAGIARDVRRDHPYAAYRDLDFQVPVRDAGDVRARFEIRVDEVHESLNLLDQLLLRLPGGPLGQHLGGLAPGRSGLGVVESPRGALVHWVRAGHGDTLDAWRVRSASFADWPALERAATGGPVADFPLVRRSFNLCHACADR